MTIAAGGTFNTYPWFGIQNCNKINGSVNGSSKSMPKISCPGLSRSDLKVKTTTKCIQGQKENVRQLLSGRWKLDSSFMFFGRWSLCSPDDSKHMVPVRKRVGTYSSDVPGGQASGIGLKSEVEVQELQEPLELNSVQEPLEHTIEETIISSKHELLQQNQNGIGRSGFVSFYRGTWQHLREENSRFTSTKGLWSLLWLLGPIALVASVVVPPFYLRKIFEAFFDEDSLLTDFLILFFTEFLFYSGVAVFLLVTDYVHRHRFQFLADKNNINNSLYGHRVVSMTTLALSVFLPLVALGLLWPWTGPAASAAIAPYLVGIIVQFAFEQYVQRKKSCIWPLVPIIFQVYRLNQLNRASQLVGGLMFSLRGAETTPQTMAINGSLTALMNLLQVLGILCLWSMTTYILRIFPSQPDTVTP